MERMQPPAMGVEEPGSHHPSLSPETGAFSLPSASCHVTLRSLGGILSPIRAVTKGWPPTECGHPAQDEAVFPDFLLILYLRDGLSSHQ